MGIKYNVFALVLGLLFSNVALADGLPGDWKSWTNAKTTLSEIGAIPGCDADISTLPEIYQETVLIYCKVKESGPGKVNILIKPEVLENYKKRDGNFPDGLNMIMYLPDIKTLFATEYKQGKPVYHVYDETGKEVTASSGDLAAATCNACHTGYANFCINGQCGKLK